MLDIIISTRFKKDLNRMRRRGKNLKKLETVLAKLQDGEEMEPRYRDHALSGDMEGYRDLHIEPDWLLVYKATADELLLSRTGSHADVFG